MFFYLSKILFLFVQPFTWFILCVLAAFLLRGAKWKKRFRIASIVLLVFFTNSFLFLTFCRMWEIHTPPITKTGNYDVGIVLGGMSEYNNDLHALSLRRGGDRIWQAISLYKAGKIKKILISGDNGYISDRGLHEAKQLKKVLVAWGLPETDILVETASKNTHENAIYTQKVLAKYPEIRTKLLITSGTHMRRSLACFEKAGLHCDAFSTDLFTGPKAHFYWDQYVVPDWSLFNDWKTLMKEWIGYLAYAMMGYV